MVLSLSEYGAAAPGALRGLARADYRGLQDCIACLAIGKAMAVLWGRQDYSVVSMYNRMVDGVPVMLRRDP